MLTYLLAVFIRVDSLSALMDFSRAVQSTSLSQSLSVNTGDHPDQAGCSPDWQGNITLSPFLGICSHLLLSFLSLVPLL